MVPQLLITRVRSLLSVFLEISLFTHIAVVVTLSAAPGGRDSSSAVSPVNAATASKSRPQKGTAAVPQSVEVLQEEVNAANGLRTTSKRLLQVALLSIYAPFIFSFQ